jgi:hypothetical protein
VPHAAQERCRLGRSKGLVPLGVVAARGPSFALRSASFGGAVGVHALAFFARYAVGMTSKWINHP